MELISHDQVNQQERARILVEFGASDREIEELLVYNQNVFAQGNLDSSFQLPLQSEPHVAIWQEYVTEAKTNGAWSTLQNVLPQLKFPIKAGISQTEAYRAATRRGVSPKVTSTTTGLVLQQPEVLQLEIHQSLAGKIPLIHTSNRDDFVAMVRAITKRNEPVEIPHSMGACMVGGYNNWERISRYRQQWVQSNSDNSELAWSKEFKQLIAQKELYQDRFMILSDGCYSNIRAAELGLTETQWRRLSLTIRLEHECTHYFTRRLFHSMRNNLLDELIADYRGIVAAIGSYRADWFLHFLGLESSGYREGGRMQNYRGQLSDGAFKVLQQLVRSAAQNLEDFEGNYLDRRDIGLPASPRQLAIENQTIMLMALTSLTIEELADSSAGDRLKQVTEDMKHLSTCYR